MSTAARPLVASGRCVMWPDRRIVELFEIEHPIVLAPMAGLGTVDLAAAVSNAGGLGSIGCAIMAPDLIVKSVAEFRRSTPKPINLNFFCHDPARADAARERAWHEKLSFYYRELGIEPATLAQRFDLPPFGEAACAVIQEVRPEVVSFHFGLPEPGLVDRVKAAGCKVISSATTVDEACWLEQHGADAIIAQGYEAGDHRGVKSTLPFCSAAARSGDSSPMGSGKSGAASDQGPNSAARRLTRTLAARPENTFVTTVWFTRAFRRASR